MSNVGVIDLGLSNSESIVDPGEEDTRVLPVVSGRMIFPSGVLHQTVGSSCLFFYIFYLLLVVPRSLKQHWTGVLMWE